LPPLFFSCSLSGLSHLFLYFVFTFRFPLSEKQPTFFSFFRPKKKHKPRCVRFPSPLLQDCRNSLSGYKESGGPIGLFVIIFLFTTFSLNVYPVTLLNLYPSSFSFGEGLPAQSFPFAQHSSLLYSPHCVFFSFTPTIYLLIN